MADGAPEQMDKYDQWFTDFLGISPKEMKARVAAREATARSAAPPASPEAPAPAQVTPPTGAVGGAHKKEDAQVEIEKLALPVVRELASSLALAAHQVFSNVIQRVKEKKKAEADEEEAKREQMVTLIITIALMPAGPLEAAVASGLSGTNIRTKVAEIVSNNAGALQSKFGARGGRVANRAFDTLMNDSVVKLADHFDAEKAKKALERGVDTLKDKSVKFAASSDKGKCVESYLDAVGKSADDSIPNLVKVILTTTSLSAAVAFYNLFEKPMHAIYEAVLSQQVDDMLSEIAEPLAQHGQAQSIGATEATATTALDEIVTILWKGRRQLAHVTRIEITGAFLSGKPDYGFRKWITPDMEASAVKMVKENLTPDNFPKDEHIPDPQLEPGERVISVEIKGADRLMLIQVEDKYGFFSRNYGVRTFKQWAENGEDERALRARGSMQIGGIDAVKLSDIKDVPST